ncbi:MAG TPA: hypothetical protein VN638_02845 [Nitrospiraceae bacterium]|nr:hypothetical protein [Nitrospiraceae bacterium]
MIAENNAEIARQRVRAEGDSIRIRSKGEAEGLRIRVIGQAKWQKTVRITLTPDYLRFNLCDSENSKFVLLPDKLNVPILINPGSDTHRPPNQDAPSPGERSLSSR